MKVVNVRKAELQKIGYQNIDQWLADENNIYVGRKNRFLPQLQESKFHNPFPINKCNTREQVIQKYREYLSQNQELLESLDELKGKKLGCWCHPENCHADVLIEFIKKMDNEQNIQKQEK